MADDEFTPCRLGKHEGTFSLAFDDFDANGASSAFEEAGFDGGGHGWQGVVEALVEMRAPELRKKLGYDPEGSMFVAFSKDRDAIRQVAGLIREGFADPALLREAMSKADPASWKGEAGAHSRGGDRRFQKHAVTLSPLRLGRTQNGA